MRVATNLLSNTDKLYFLQMWRHSCLPFQFGDDGFNVMRRSAAHAEVLYQHPTLVYPIIWEISGNLGIPDTITADENNL